MKRISLLAGIGLTALGCAAGTVAESSETNETIATSESALASASATLHFTADWGTGYCAEVAVVNGLDQASTRWQLVFDLKNTFVTGSWGGKLSANSGNATATPVDYNTAIPPGGNAVFGFCANAPNASVRPALLAWNVESSAYASCPTSSGLMPAKAALAVAMAKELGRWTPNVDLTISGGRVALSYAGLMQCGAAGCPNTKALLGQQDSSVMQYVDQTLFNPTNFSADLQASFGRQSNLMMDLARNRPGQLPPTHKLKLVGGPTDLGKGSCGPHYVFQIDDANGNPLSSAQATNMGNALCFYGYGDCGNNGYLGFMQTGVSCPPGRTCIAIDPTDGDNGSTSTTSAGSAPSYPMNRVYDPANALLNTGCITSMHKLGSLMSKCAASPSTCGYLYCISSY